MKKISVLGLCLLAGSCLHAQNFGIWDSFHQGHSNKLAASVERAAAKQPQKLSWMQAVKHQIAQATPQGMVGLKFDYVVPQADQSHTAQAPYKRMVQNRAQYVQHALTQNPTLKDFTFKVLCPQDLTELKGSDVNYVTHFLQSYYATQVDQNPFDVQEYKHYMVRVSLLTGGPTEVHLFFNCYAKEMYLVYGTALLPNITLEALPQRF